MPVDTKSPVRAHMMVIKPITRLEPSLWIEFEMMEPMARVGKHKKSCHALRGY
jgi:hypothetical protein